MMVGDIVVFMWLLVLIGVGGGRCGGDDWSLMMVIGGDRYSLLYVITIINIMRKVRKRQIEGKPCYLIYI